MLVFHCYCTHNSSPQEGIQAYKRIDWVLVAVAREAVRFHVQKVVLKKYYNLY